MSGKKHSPKAFRPTKGFTHLNLQSRVMRVLRHQKQHHIGIRVLETQAMVGRSEREEFYELLDSWEQQGKIWRRRNSVVLSQNQGLVEAKIVNLTERFGFARPLDEDKQEKLGDIFLPGRYMQGAMPGDTVLVRVKPMNHEDNRPEGSVVRIIEQNNAPFTGVVVRDNGRYYIRPDKMSRFMWEVNKGQLNGAHAGDKVLAQLTHRSDNHFYHQVAVMKAFGSAEYAQYCCEAV